MQAEQSPSKAENKYKIKKIKPVEGNVS